MADPRECEFSSVATLPCPHDTRPPKKTPLTDQKKGTTNSNDAFTISLLRPQPQGLTALASFNPRFTYSIFGDDETIYGYQNLRINLQYRANDMRPNLQVSYAKKLSTAAAKTDVPDVRAVLQDGGHLPKSMLGKDALN